MSNNQIERRRYVRHRTTLDVDVSIFADGRMEPLESTVLKDISGGGAKFVTRHLERYPVGQEIHLTIYLPDIGRSRESIECSARVAWASEAECSTSGEMLEATVGVAMDYVLDLEKISVSAVRHARPPVDSGGSES